MDAKWTINFRADELKDYLRGQIYLGVLEVISQHVVPEAKQLSPVDTGNNRASIDYEVNKVANGVTASIFSQSGYGGYLEIGTSKMRAQPYLYPAWAQFQDKLGSTIASRIRATRTLTGMTIEGGMTTFG